MCKGFNFYFRRTKQGENAFKQTNVLTSSPPPPSQPPPPPPPPLSLPPQTEIKLKPILYLFATDKTGFIYLFDVGIEGIPKYVQCEGYQFRSFGLVVHEIGHADPDHCPSTPRFGWSAEKPGLDHYAATLPCSRPSCNSATRMAVRDNINVRRRRTTNHDYYANARQMDALNRP